MIAQPLPGAGKCPHDAYLTVEPGRWRIRELPWQDGSIPSAEGTWCLACGKQLDGSQDRANCKAQAEARKLKREQMLAAKRARWRKHHEKCREQRRVQQAEREAKQQAAAAAAQARAEAQERKAAERAEARRQREAQVRAERKANPVKRIKGIDLSAYPNWTYVRAPYIAPAIMAYMERSGASYRDLAKLSGVDHKTLWRLCHRNGSIEWGAAIRLATVVGATLPEIDALPGLPGEVRRLRIGLGLSPSAAARDMGIPSHMVAYLERGGGVPAEVEERIREWMVQHG